jgi:hypothetical protein
MMRIFPNLLTPLSGILFAAGSTCAIGAAPSSPSAIELAQKQISAYLAQLADLHCKETVTQEKLSGNGHVEASARAQFDYLIMMGGSGDEFQLNESRVASDTEHVKQSQLPLLVTNGMSTVLLVFHPYYRDSFSFEVGADETVDGKPAIPIHFTHITGRRTPAALALRGREYPLDLQGTAWLDKKSGAVVKIEANLLRDMSDVGLRSLDVHVEYKPIKLSADSAPIALPSLAVVDVTTPRQHWRNRHVFDGYRTFSTEVEQDPNVKIRAESAKPDSSTVAGVPSSDTKEKP